MNKNVFLFLPLLFMLVSCIGMEVTNLEISGIQEGVTEGVIVSLRESETDLTIIFTSKEEKPQEILIAPFKGDPGSYTKPDKIITQMKFTPAGPERRVQLYHHEELLALMIDKGGALFFLESGARFIPAHPIPVEQLPENVVPRGRIAVNLLLERTGGDQSQLETGRPFTLTKGDETWELMIFMATIPDEGKQEKDRIAYEGLPLEIDWVGIRIK